MNDTNMGDILTIMASAERKWKQLAHDWQAVLLGALMLMFVLAGISIPW